MSDTDGNTPVDVNLDDFEKAFFSRDAQPEPKPEEIEETPEDTGEESEVEADTEVETDVETEVEDEEAEEDEEPVQPKKNRKTAKERIHELAAERKAEREAREAAERRLADLEAKLLRIEENTKPTEVKAVEVEDKPSAPDPDATDDKGELIYPLGEFDPKYISDLTKFTIQQETARVRAEQEAADKARREQEDQDKVVSEWNDRLTATEEELPDLREKLATLDQTFYGLEPTYGTFLANAIMSMERGPEVLYYLADNISEAQRIVASGPTAATIALGRLEAHLPSKEAEDRNKKKVSKAPTPPAVTRGTGAARIVRPDTDDLDAFEREFFKS